MSSFNKCFPVRDKQVIAGEDADAQSGGFLRQGDAHACIKVKQNGGHGLRCEHHSGIVHLMQLGLRRTKDVKQFINPDEHAISQKTRAWISDGRLCMKCMNRFTQCAGAPEEVSFVDLIHCECVCSPYEGHG